MKYTCDICYKKTDKTGTVLDIHCGYIAIIHRPSRKDAKIFSQPQRIDELHPCDKCIKEIIKEYKKKK